MNLLNLKNVSKIYNQGKIEVPALRGVNLEIDTGEFATVFGPSGSGKTTLLNIIGCLDKPTDGTIKFDGNNIADLDKTELAEIRRKNIGFVFQSFNLIDELTCYENVELPLLYLKTPADERKRRVEEVLTRMGIMHRKDHFPQQLSGGQQQRVAIARAIVAKPSVILADEPTGNLDSANGEEVMRLLEELNNEGTTIVMVTHSPHDANYAHRIINLFDGKVVTENIREQFHI